jgi:hypothetical protein
MLPDWLNRNAALPIRKLLGVILGSTMFGSGFVRYAQLADGSGPVLDILTVYGLWSLSAIIIVVAAFPTAWGYSVSYSYAIPFGLLFGAVSVIGIAYTGQPPSQLEKFGSGLLIGVGSALTLGTLAATLGTLWKEIIGKLRHQRVSL